MKKIILFATALSLSVMAVQAQSRYHQKFTFGGGVNLGLPTGDFSNGWNVGVGFQLQGELEVAHNATAVFTTGYSDFFGKTLDLPGFSGKLPNVGFIPFLAGIRLYPSEQFFIGGQIGLGTFTNTGASGNTGFDFYPQLGFNGNSCQLIMGYNIVSLSGGSNTNLLLTAIFKFGGN
jgi:hypothetical protein